MTDSALGKETLFRLGDAGTVNIPNSTLDYLAKVAVMETSSGQGGKDLAALRGVTIPIRITGKFDSPHYSVDVASLAAELAKSQLGDKARDEINKVVPGLGDALKGLFGR